MSAILRRLVLVGTAVWLSIAAGCAKPTSAHGKVTYDGKPIEQGAITFLPANGVGPSDGAPIKAGEYAARITSPGRKIAQIIAVKAVPFARSSQEMASRAKAAAARGDGSGLIDRADVVPANAEGNNTTVEIQLGPQELNFDLRPPK
jgi:hypothetical protein